MTTPGVAFGRFVIGILLGCVIGLFYGFLRPVQKGRAILADTVFAIFAGWVLVYYGFAVCRGDLRMGYLFAAGAGAVGWDLSFGRWLRPVFGRFWRFLGRILPPVKKIFKKIRNFIKFLFATAKKWVTIKRRIPTSPKGARYGQKKIILSVIFGSFSAGPPR